MSTGLRELTPSLVVLHSRVMSYNAGMLVRGRDAVLIDPGLFADEIDRIKAHIYGQGASPSKIVLTHSHWDHILGPEYFPGVPVIQQLESLAVPAEVGTYIERQATEWERQSGFQRDLPFLMPVPDQTFADRLELTLGDKTIELLHAPGHAPEQLVVYDPGEATLWAADMLSDIEIPFVMQSFEAYRTTLERLARLDVGVLVPGHGAATNDKAEIRQRFAEDQEYIAELLRRVTRVVQQGWSAGEALATCADMRFRQAELNARPHRLNVETAFSELGGASEPGHEGWNRLL